MSRKSANRLDAERQIKALVAKGDIPRFKAIKGNQVREFEAEFAQAWPRLQELGAAGFNNYIFAQDVPYDDLDKANDSHVEDVRVLFADGDDADLPTDWHINPTFTLENPDTGRWWAFWRMKDCPLDQLNETQRRIAQHYRTDKSVCNPSRVVRLAGLPRWKKGQEYAPYEFVPGSGKTSRFRNHDSHLPEVAAERTKAHDPKQINVRQDQRHNIKAYLHWLNTEARGAVEGGKPATRDSKAEPGRNDTLAATAAMGHSYALTAETTADLLREFYADRLDPPLGDEEFDRTVESGFNSASSNQGNKTSDYREQRTEELAKLFEDRTAKDHGKDGKEPEDDGPFRVWTHQELCDRPEPQWLLEGMIPEQGYAILYGAPETFKSFTALGVGACVSTITDWHGKKVATRPDGSPRRVMYCMGEGAFDIHRRLNAWTDHHGLPKLDGKQFMVIEPAPMLRFPADVEAFMDTIKRYGDDWDLIIVDTIGRTVGGINDHAGEGARMFSALTKRIRKELGAATLAITHTPKGDVEDIVGSQAYLADADMTFNTIATSDRTIINLRQGKIKYGKPWPKDMAFRSQDVGECMVLIPCPVRRTKKDKDKSRSITREVSFKAALRKCADDEGFALWPNVKAAMVTASFPNSATKDAETYKQQLDNWFSKWPGRDIYETGETQGRSIILELTTEDNQGPNPNRRRKRSNVRHTQDGNRGNR